MEERHDDGPDGFAFDRRSMLRKLAVGGTLVWSAPMIGSRASALMPPSVCMNDVELDWTALFPSTNPNVGGGGSTPSATFSDVEGSGVDVTISSVIVGTNPKASNYQIQASPHGGITGKSLRFDQDPEPNTASGGNPQEGGQTVTITFSTTVRNIRFTLTDIDNVADSWSDRITLITAASSVSTGGNIIGIGAPGNGTGGANPDVVATGGTNTATGAYRNNVADQNLGDNSGLGNVQLTYNGPIDTLSFRYWCGGVGGGSSTNQRINLSNIVFDTCPEGVSPGLAPQQSPTVESELRVPALEDEPVGPPPPGVD